MEIGISTASFFTKMYTEESIVPIAKMGAKFCEIFFATHCEYTNEFGEKILSELDKAQCYSPLQVHSVHALTNQFEPELFSLNDRAYCDAIKVFENVCKIAKQIGAKNYTFHGATMLKKAIKYNFNYQHISKRVNNLCELAESYGVKLCYENVHWAYFCNPEYFDIVKQLCPNLGAVLDIKQAMQSNIEVDKYIPVMQDRLKTVHLCDYSNEFGVEMPGKGKYDFVGLFEKLLNIGFEGNCLLEIYAKSYKNEQELYESYKYLCDCLDIAKNKIQ